MFSRKSHDSSVRVPARPKRGSRYRYFKCGSTPDAAFEVISTRQDVVVPAGTFEVFVLYSAERQQKEYWSEREGLIRIDKLRKDGSLIGKYELISKKMLMP